jgi:transposase InsO family protein
MLEELTVVRGSPAHLRSDNGPEYVSAAVGKWCKESRTGTPYVDLGSPRQSGIMESFKWHLRDELLSSEIFATLAEARLPVCRLERPRHASAGAIHKCTRRT